MKYRWKKKYSREDALSEIQSCQMSIQTSWEYIVSVYQWKVSPIILAMCHTTPEESIEQEIEKMDYQRSKIEYLRQFT